jgi:hypothetical protein
MDSNQALNQEGARARTEVVLSGEERSWLFLVVRELYSFSLFIAPRRHRRLLPPPCNGSYRDPCQEPLKGHLSIDASRTPFRRRRTPRNGAKCKAPSKTPRAGTFSRRKHSNFFNYTRLGELGCRLVL